MLPRIVNNQNTDGTITKACIIFREDGRYGLIISGKTEGAPINKSSARIDVAVERFIA